MSSTLFSSPLEETVNTTHRNLEGSITTSARNAPQDVLTLLRALSSEISKRGPGGRSTIPGDSMLKAALRITDETLLLLESAISGLKSDANSEQAIRFGSLTQRIVKNLEKVKGDVDKIYSVSASCYQTENRKRLLTFNYFERCLIPPPVGTRRSCQWQGSRIFRQR